jgi:hypothetical protein
MQVIDICIAFIASTSIYSPVVPSDTTPPSSDTVLPSQAASAETPTAPAAERDGDSPGPHRSATALLGATALRIAAAAAVDSAPWRLGSLAAGALAAVRCAFRSSPTALARSKGAVRCAFRKSPTLLIKSTGTVRHAFRSSPIALERSKGTKVALSCTVD